MTIQELSQLYRLNQEIRMDEERLARLELKAQPGATTIDGMPHGTTVGDRVARYAAEIADLHGIIAAKHSQCLYERNRLERYIMTVPDSLTRQIMTYRFISGMSWSGVAMALGGITADAARMICTRYVQADKAV